GYDHTIRFWEALSGICSRTIQHPDSQVNRLCISPDKRYLAAAGRGSVKLYDIKNTNPNPVLAFEGHTGNVTGVGWHCEGKWLVTSSEDGTVKIWDTRTATVQRNYSHPGGFAVNDVVIHPNQGELISVDRGGNVRIWDLGQSKCTHHLVPEEDVSIASVTVATDGSMLCVGNNRGNVFAWRMLPGRDTTSLVPLAKFSAHQQYITRILLSPDVRHLATCSADHTARIWSADITVPPTTPTASATPTSPPSLASSTSSSPAPSSTTSSSTSPALAAAAPTSPPPSRAGKPQSKDSSAFTARPNVSASRTATATATTATTTPPTGPLSKLNDASHFPDHIGGAESITTPAFPLETTLHGHQRWVWDCAFSADSAYLVTACSDHYARLWELSSQSIIRQYNGHHRGAVCVALNDYSER
ncbi:MAG: TOR complex subunit lst8, partial [Lichina confinis]